MSEFDRIIGYENEKAELMRISDVLVNRAYYAKMGVKLPKGLLLHGKPGVGKSLMADCLIKETGRQAFVIRKDKPNGEFVNHIKDTFETAKKNEPSIVLLDDMDKFANEDDKHLNAEEYVTVQSCIDEVAGYDVFVIATANDIYNLPESLQRAGRFDAAIAVDVPKGRCAELIIEHYLKDKPIKDDFDIKAIARMMHRESCATLETVINEAAIYAGYEKREQISYNDIVKACMRVIFGAPESINAVDVPNRDRIAVHEAGHAVVAEILRPDSVHLVSIKSYEGEIGGITLQDEFTGYGMCYKEREYSILVSMGGKAAIEVVYGEPDMGCEHDMAEAELTIRSLVDELCSYGFNSFVKPTSSSWVIENCDRIVAERLAAYYEQAKKLLIDNRAFLDSLAESLMKKETLVAKDIAMIKEKAVEIKNTHLDI